MKIGAIKKQAQTWAQMFVKSETDFIADYRHTVEIGRFEPEDLNIIVSLAQVYENYLTKLITNDEAVKRQKAILAEAG